MTQAAQSEPTRLESKWWYRLLRVILIPLYAVVLLTTLWIIYGEYHPRKVFDQGMIVCDDGKSYRLAAIGYVSPLEPGEQLTGSDADAARNLCSYGQTSAPSEGLGTVKMPDGALITGVPLPAIDPKTGERISGTGTKGPDLMARYQRWRDSLAKEAPPSFSVDRTQPFQAFHSYTVNMAFRTEGSWAKTVSYMAIAWLVIHLAFVMVRGAVLYVAVGRFLPVSGLRGWLTL